MTSKFLLYSQPLNYDNHNFRSCMIARVCMFRKYSWGADYTNTSNECHRLLGKEEDNKNQLQIEKKKERRCTQSFDRWCKHLLYFLSFEYWSSS